MLKSLLLIALIPTAIFVTPWAWFGVALIALWKWRIWYRYNGRPWRKIHFNAMIFAAAALAREHNRSSVAGTPVSLKNVYMDMVNSLEQIGFNVNEDVSRFVDRQLDLLRDQYDEPWVIQYMVEVCGYSHQEALTKLLTEYPKVNPDDNQYKIRAVIAGVVENHFSVAHRAEYWYEVLNGKAT